MEMPRCEVGVSSLPTWYSTCMVNISSSSDCEKLAPGDLLNTLLLVFSKCCSLTTYGKDYGFKQRIFFSMTNTPELLTSVLENDNKGWTHRARPYSSKPASNAPFPAIQIFTSRTPYLSRLIFNHLPPLLWQN